MRKRGWFFPVGLMLLASSLVWTAACRGSAPGAPVETVKDLMLSKIDPSADAVWLSVTTVQSAEGTLETVPQNDADWEKVRNGAIALTEGADLLMLPRPVAAPGDKSETPGVELEPSEIDALIGKDRASWEMRAKALHDAGVAARQAAEAKDPQKVFEIGEQIEVACESCHSQFWYPNEKIPPVSINLR